MLVDTHCHLGDAAYASDRDEVAVRASRAGVRHIVVIGDRQESSEAGIALATSRAGLSATAGVHPHHADSWSDESAAWLRDACGNEAVVAIGETGLDYHYEHAARQQQRRSFEAQLKLAADARLPVVVHSREADADMIAMLQAHPDSRCILHSFSSGAALLATGIHRGDYISFSGMITFRSWTLDDAVRDVPATQLLLETDGPYLAPVPLRGKRNEPAYITHVAARVGDVRGISAGDVAAVTTENAERAFGPRITSTVLEEAG